jgi:hypothetical protein
VQTEATRTCELLVGLRDVTVLGVDERLRQPLEVCVDPQHPGSIALSRSQKVQVPLFDAVTSKWGMPPKCCYTGDPRALDRGPSNHTQVAPSMSLMSPSNSSTRGA